MPAAMHSFYLRKMYLKNRLAQARRHHPRRHADRPREGEDAGLFHLDDRRPHRAVDAPPTPARNLLRPASSCSAARATSPASSIRRRPTSTATGPTPSWSRCARLAGRRHQARGLVVERLEQVDGLAQQGQASAGAHPWQCAQRRQTQAAGRRTRLVRQVPARQAVGLKPAPEAILHGTCPERRSRSAFQGTAYTKALAGASRRHRPCRQANAIASVAMSPTPA